MSKAIIEQKNKKIIEKIENLASREQALKIGGTLIIKMMTDGRLTTFEGICVAISRKGIASSVTLRKMSGSIGVEKTFPIYSPLVTSITKIRQGKVRRAKLYFLRNLRGAMKLKEKISFGKKTEKA